MHKDIFLRTVLIVNGLFMWLCFSTLVLAMLAIDLGIFHRRAHKVSTKEAAIWTTVWVALALSFAYGVYQFKGSEPAEAFVASYLIELSLSVDNVLVFIVILSYFQIPVQYQHRILFFGILSALVMRATMIAAGLYLIHHFHWITYIFGAFLVYTGFRLLTHDETKVATAESNQIVRLVRCVFPTTEQLHGQKFFVQENVGLSAANRLAVTPLFVALVAIEFTDLVFALDSIPAVMAVTLDPFIVYTSNVFAILALRSLYFLLVGAMNKIRFLTVGLSAVLCFVGIKMLIAGVYQIPIAVSLAVIALFLAVAMVSSLLLPTHSKKPLPGSRPAAPVPIPPTAPRC